MALRAVMGPAEVTLRAERFAVLSVEIDVAWQPAEDFTQRYVGILDALSRLVEVAGVRQASYSCTSRPERRLTTIVLEGRVPVEPES